MKEKAVPFTKFTLSPYLPSVRFLNLLDEGLDKSTVDLFRWVMGQCVRTSQTDKESQQRRLLPLPVVGLLNLT